VRNVHKRLYNFRKKRQEARSLFLHVVYKTRQDFSGSPYISVQNCLMCRNFLALVLPAFVPVSVLCCPAHVRCCVVLALLCCCLLLLMNIIEKTTEQQIVKGAVVKKIIFLICIYIHILQKLKLKIFKCRYTRMHSKKGQHNVLYHQMRISIMHHYTALGGATFTKNGREIFTCEKFPFFPMDPGYFCDTYKDEYLADPTPLNSSA